MRIDPSRSHQAYTAMDLQSSDGIDIRMTYSLRSDAASCRCRSWIEGLVLSLLSIYGDYRRTTNSNLQTIHDLSIVVHAPLFHRFLDHILLGTTIRRRFHLEDIDRPLSQIIGLVIPTGSFPSIPSELAEKASHCYYS